MKNDNKIIQYDGGGPNLAPYEVYPAPGMFGFPFSPQKHLREYLRLILKRKWVILAFILTALAISTIYTLRQVPEYMATAYMEIDIESATILPYQDFNKGDGGYNYMYEEYLQTQIKHITSRNLAKRVVLAMGMDRQNPSQSKPESNKKEFSFLEKLGLASEENAQLQPPPTREEKIEQGIDEILGGLSVTPIKNSRVIEISYSSPDPALAARIANTVSQEYIDYNFQAKYNATSRATDFLQKQLVDLKIKVEKSDAAMVDYARSHNITGVSEKQDLVLQTLEDLNRRLTAARSISMEKESAYKTLEDATPENFPQALRTSLIETLEGRLLVDEQELARLTSQLGSSMPQVKELQSKVVQARQQLLREKQLAIRHSRIEYDTALANERLIVKAYDKQKVMANQLNDAGIQFNILRREAETNKQLYDSLLQRVKEAGVAASLKSTNIQVVDEAKTPIAPYSPDLRKNLALALMMGLMGGVGFALFLNYFDNNVKTPEDVDELLGLPSLGLIPSIKSANGRYGYLTAGRKKRKLHDALVKHGVELASLTSGSSLIAEAYRGVRTALLLSSPDDPPKMIEVTSARSGEGKTTTVCNVALSLSQTGKLVLILDCDLHRSNIKKIFNINGSGMSEYLTGQIDFESMVQKSTIPNLYIAHAGVPPPNASELLGSERMKDALEAAYNIFDYILIDTPPLMSVSDALILAPMADGVIMVTKGGKNPPDILRKTKKSLELVHANILGVICNNVNLNSSDYHYYYHRYLDYSSYVGEENQDSAPRRY